MQWKDLLVSLPVAGAGQEKMERQQQTKESEALEVWGIFVS